MSNEREIGRVEFEFQLGRYVHLHANNLGECMTPSLLHQSYGLNNRTYCVIVALVGNQSVAETNSSLLRENLPSLS